MAGSIGLEPILYATKKRCITIMLRSNIVVVPRRIELLFPGWKPDVLTDRRRDRYMVEDEGYAPSP